MRTLFLSTLLFIISLSNLKALDNNPVANKDAIVQSGSARFTVLTPRVIRLEWSQDSVFEDHASIVFINRNLPVPKFEQKMDGKWLVLTTEFLELRYLRGSGEFNEKNLEISFLYHNKKDRWFPGRENKGNLLGTTRTLDGWDGPTQGNKDQTLDPGILSKEGWVLIDDSERPLFDQSDWPWVMERDQKDIIDWYFFGYGTDYKSALYDYTQIAGKIALPPKFVFGLWWSRYWAYTDQEYKELVGEFEQHQIPLEVFVIDMDWHITEMEEWYVNGVKQPDQAGERAGWTGFTWSDKYFPDPEGFLKWTDQKNLKTCLNLHPASGIQPHEAVYPEFAKAMGVDPATKKYIPFNITDKNYAKNYFEIVLHPMEDMGVDFWWLDWQQWGSTAIPGVNPTFYLNYAHFSDMERRGRVRPLIFHRWGGLGNHRYQIGFSGDTYVTWKSLNYQPYFTSTASNVCFGFWSHDIGGHMGGTSETKRSPELYTRWIQWGIFSPILRTHCTKDPALERRIWAYPNKYFEIMKDCINLRYELFPYIYTAARESHDSGVSLIRPMYYENPLNEDAYQYSGQYYFGNDMIVAPVTKQIPRKGSQGSKKMPKSAYDENVTQTFLVWNQDNSAYKGNGIVKTDDDQKGYVCEIAFAEDELGKINLEKDMQIGFDLYVNDLDKNERKDGTLCWHAKSAENHINPQNFKQIYLKDDQSKKDKNCFYKTQEKPVIDGKIDQVWDQVEFFQIKNVIMGEPTIQEAQFKVLWTEDSLYLLVQVRDDILSNHGEQPYFNDGLEIFVDMQPILEHQLLSLTVDQKIWLPQGTWFEWKRGEWVDGDQEVNYACRVQDIPLFLKEGAVIPMRTSTDLSVSDLENDTTILLITPGKSGETVIYDDHGNNQDYLEGQFAKTTIQHSQKKNIHTVIIHPVQGSFDGMVESKTYRIEFPMTFPPDGMKNNLNKEMDWYYCGDQLKTVVFLEPVSIRDSLVIEVEFPKEDKQILSGIRGRLERIKEVSQSIHRLGWNFNSIYLLENMVDIVQTGNRISGKSDASEVLKEINEFIIKEKELIQILKQVSEKDFRMLSLYHLLAEYE